MLMNIWVKDTASGHVHQVGTDPHDSLEMFHGVVHYVNMQCMEGTLGGGYEFVEAPDVDDYVSVTPDELMLNRKMIHEDMMKMLAERKCFNTETCVCCGAEIPEGRQVYPVCENGEDK